MKLLVLAVLVLVALAIYFLVRAINARVNSKWQPDVRTLENGESEVFLLHGKNELVVSNIAPLKNYEANGKSEIERRIDIEIAMDEAKAYAKDL